METGKLNLYLSIQISGWCWIRILKNWLELTIAKKRSMNATGSQSELSYQVSGTWTGAGNPEETTAKTYIITIPTAGIIPQVPVSGWNGYQHYQGGSNFGSSSTNHVTMITVLAVVCCLLVFFGPLILYLIAFASSHWKYSLYLTSNFIKKSNQPKQLVPVMRDVNCKSNDKVKGRLPRKIKKMLIW